MVQENREPEAKKKKQKNQKKESFLSLFDRARHTTLSHTLYEQEEKQEE